MPTQAATWPLIAAAVLGLSACRTIAAGMPPPRQPHTDLRRVEAPTEPFERAALAELPAMRSDRVELAVAFPDRFDRAQEHPILITQVTSDRARSNIAELSAYAPTALALGYVVLTAQGIPWPTTARSDTLAHRYASVRAALRWLAGEVPQSQHWPIVLAGFSGGAKISQALRSACPSKAGAWPACSWAAATKNIPGCCFGNIRRCRSASHRWPFS
jgi:hypothetical protein